MSERPILFSAPMVCALLAGEKTQTRRIYQPRYPEPYEVVEDGVPHQCGEDGVYHRRAEPYGVAGDRLWVRETWMEIDGDVFYRATDPMWDEERENTKVKWRPSIFMRRQFSRISLDVTDVRVERLQDIDPEDAMREGVGALDFDEPLSSTEAFRRLWEKINGIASWDANPRVWVVSFARATRQPPTETP